MTANDTRPGATVGTVERSSPGHRAGGQPPAMVSAVLLLCGIGAATMLALVFVTSTGQVSGEMRSGQPARDIVLWGITDSVWMRVLMAVDAGFLIWCATAVHRKWRRTGRVPSACPLFIGWATVALLDPIVNWAMYVTYNPRLVHFPIDMPWADITPIEPLWPLIGMAWAEWFLGQALIAGYLTNRLLNRAAAGSWSARHPFWTRALVGFGVGVVLDPIAELFVMNAGMWTYWQNAGPVLQVGIGYLPVSEIITAALICALWTVLMHEDEAGRSTSSHIAQRIGALRARRGAELLVAVAITWLFVIVAYGGYFGGARLARWATQVSGEWPYSSLEVYDPNGLQPAAVDTFEGNWAPRLPASEHARRDRIAPSPTTRHPVGPTIREPTRTAVPVGST